MIPGHFEFGHYQDGHQKTKMADIFKRVGVDD